MAIAQFITLILVKPNYTVLLDALETAARSARVECLWLALLVFINSARAGDRQFSQSTASWQFDVIDRGSFRDVGKYASLGYTPEGLGVIGYYDRKEGAVKVARQSATGWEIETIDSKGDAGRGLSLAVGPRGEVAVSYYEMNPPRSLKCARFVNDAWSIEVVEAISRLSGSPSESTSVAFDSTGRIGIAYKGYEQNPAAEILGYAELRAGEWNVVHIEHDALGAHDFTAIRSSLAYSSRDSPAIAFTAIDSDWDPDVESNISKATVYCATQEGRDWAIGLVHDGEWTVSDGSLIDAQCGLAFGQDDRPAISFYDRKSRQLLFANYNGVAWSVESVDDDGSVGQYSSLAFDAKGNPAVSYFDEGEGTLKFATRDDEIWEIKSERRRGDGSHGRYTSLAFTPEGKAAVAFYEFSPSSQHPSPNFDEGGLVYAVEGRRLWSHNPKFSEPIAAGSASLAINSVGSAAVLYLDTRGEEWRPGQFRRRNVLLFSYIHESFLDRPLVVEVEIPADPDSKGMQISSPCLTFDQEDRPLVSYIRQRGISSELVYAELDGIGGWRKEMVDEIEGGSLASLACSPTGLVHIAFPRTLGSTMDIAIRTSEGEWEFEKVLGLGDRQIETVSLRFSKAGDIGIAYGALVSDPVLQVLEDKVFYASRFGGDWTTTSIDHGNRPTLAFNGKQIPSMCYSRRSFIGGEEEGLTFAYLSEDEWVTELISKENVAGRLAYSDEGRPMVAWHRWNVSGLEIGTMLAERETSGWTTEQVSLGAAFQAVQDLVITPFGQPLIAHDSTAGFQLSFGVADEPGPRVTSVERSLENLLVRFVGGVGRCDWEVQGSSNLDEFERLRGVPFFERFPGSFEAVIPVSQSVDSYFLRVLDPK